MNVHISLFFLGGENGFVLVLARAGIEKGVEGGGREGEGREEVEKRMEDGN